MQPFLQQVARHYFDVGGVERNCMVFPNRRSLVFFSKYLAECVKGCSAPLLMPQMLTMNDFFARLSGTRCADRIQLLLILYSCYKKLRPSAESLDDFVFWGDVLLGDFDDVDKYLVDPEQIFRNVADFKEMQDSYSYLSDAQVEAIRRFMSHFHKDGRLTVDIGSDSPDVKARFLQIWDILLPLYRSFNIELEDRGIAYEGQIYRQVASQIVEEPVADMFHECFKTDGKVVFIGLNALNECEKTLMRKMRDAGIAEFCWDYSGEMLKDPRNKSSVFMSSNVLEFPQAAEWDQDGLSQPEIGVISVPSSVGQAKQLPGILGQIADPGIDTAIVLPDENLLIPTLNSIPEDIRDINVTMGYPMSGSEFYSLLEGIASMQMHVRKRSDGSHFYHKQVWEVFSNSIFKSCLDEDGKRKVADIKSEARYYIPQADLNGHPVFDLIFNPVVDDVKSESADQISRIARYLSSVITGLAPYIKDNPDMALELEFAREYYLSVRRLARESLPVRPDTYFRLLAQMTAGISVPFKGEPLKGLQIMGPLETRSLDFDNIVILACNEGIFPRRSVSSSFIPPELRKGFGLPTYEYQDAIWAYYFYRLMQRASKVWLLYDSRTENMKSGEESRYIKQLELHFGSKLTRYLTKSVISAKDTPEPISKTEEDVRTIRSSKLSASALKNYLTCPAKFYYSLVKGLKKETEVVESLDAGMTGNVFHKTMHQLYDGRKTVSAAYIDSLLKDPEGVRATVDSFICEEMNASEVTGRNLILADVITKYVLKVLERDREFIASNAGRPFTILGLELKELWKFDGFDFIGYIDRLDSVCDGEVRVVDYKTGKVEDEDIHIDDSNAETVVESLFDEENSQKPLIALQLFLYDMFIKSKDAFSGCRIDNSIYQTGRMFVSPVENVPMCDKFCDLMKERLSGLLETICDTSVPFRRTEDSKTCSWCDFKEICGR